MATAFLALVNKVYQVKKTQEEDTEIPAKLMKEIHLKSYLLPIYPNPNTNEQLLLKSLTSWQLKKNYCPIYGDLSQKIPPGC